MLAHPERSPAFLPEPARIANLVDAGVLCSITAGSMMGRFGKRVRRFTLDLLRSGLVHNVASDAHDLDRRPPGLLAGFAAVEGELPVVAAAADWFAGEAAAAILAGEPLPGSPPTAVRRGGWRRLTLRRG